MATAKEEAINPVLEPAGAGPMTEKQRMGNVRIGSEKDVTPAQRKEIERNMPMEPVKKAKGGTASARADGIASRGKTRGTIVMCKGGMYKK